MLNLSEGLGFRLHFKGLRGSVGIHRIVQRSGVTQGYIGCIRMVVMRWKENGK